MEPNLLEQLDAKALGEQLFEARKKAQLTQADAAAILGVARTTITAIEAGERRVRPAELIKLSAAYGRPFTSFTRPRPALQSVVPQLRASFRNRPQWEEELAPILADLDEVLKDYLELYRILGLEASLRYVPEYDVEGLTVTEAAESIAITERNRLGIGDGPLTNVRDLLEQDAFISVFVLPLPSWCSGFYIFSSELGAIIGLRRDDPPERQRSTATHEYAHFLTNRHGSEIMSNLPSSRMTFEEKLASEFPSHFLMPGAGVKRRVSHLKQSTGGLKARALIDLAAYYGVSVEALLRWLEDLRQLPVGTFDEAKRCGFAIRQIQAEAGISAPADRQDLFPLKYQQLAFQAVQLGAITEGRFAEFLRIDRVEARRLTRALRVEESSQALPAEAAVAG